MTAVIVEQVIEFGNASRRLLVVMERGKIRAHNAETAARVSIDRRTACALLRSEDAEPCADPESILGRARQSLQPSHDRRSKKTQRRTRRPRYNKPYSFAR